MAGAFWDAEQLIGSVPKGTRGEEIQVRRVQKRGKVSVDVRVFYRDDADELAPGKGVVIPVEMAGQVADLIRQAVEQF